jgi:GNAT superfamily N-acetyltransferase
MRSRAGPSSMAGPPLEGVPSHQFEGIDREDLSPWFNPFLRRFAEDTVRCGGEVRVIRDGGTLVGLMVSDPVERVASAFTRSHRVAETLVRGRGPFGMYCDFLLDPSAEAFDIFSSRLDLGRPPNRFRHPVREIRADDLPSVLDLLREVEGVVNGRWFEGLPNANEAGFLSEVDGRLAGVAWVSRVGTHARLHSLAVRAPHRRMGLGGDLLLARLLWARRCGATEALSEIAERNVASQAVALRAGMQRVGRIYFYRPL